jgi:hypothetical protein
MRDDVCRSHTVALEEFVEPAKRVQVLEFLVTSRAGVPLVVAFGVDGHKKGWPRESAHRS